jgi:hypothetical protein
MKSQHLHSTQYHSGQTLINQVIEITLADPNDTELDIVRYALPAET